MTLLIDSLLLGSAMRSRSNAGASFTPAYRTDRPSRAELQAIFTARKTR